MANGWAFEQRATRRAILFADLVESVRLYQQQEARTIARWNRFAEEVRARIASLGLGRLVRVVGDGLLLDFAGASEATRTAFELHRSIAALNEPGDTEGTFALRVGLHVAEVVEGHDNIFGAGVNLAQRLCAMAQPGGTTCSAAFRAELGDGVQADIHDMGERVVKNLAEPVRAFALQPPGERPTVNLPSTEDLRPAVAVVPFVAMPADPENDALGHAMADDIIASLSRHPGLRVLSRAGMAALRDSVLPPSRLRELLGADFLLSGHFRVVGQRIRLHGELSELRHGVVLWAAAISGDAQALFEGSDELVPHIVSQVSQQVHAHELTRVRSLPMDTLSSYSLFLGASGLLDSLVARDFNAARTVIEHLAERHPRQAAPHALLAIWHTHRMLQGWSAAPQRDARAIGQHAEAALERDPALPAALVAHGIAAVFERRDFDSAERDYRQALRHDPSCAAAWARLSECESQAGDHEAAFASAMRALSLSPLDPQRYVYESYAARAAFVNQAYERAIELARASVRRHALHAPPHRLLIAALWLSGREAEARRAVHDMRRLLPEARADDGSRSSQHQPARTPFVQALLSAGLPE